MAGIIKNILKISAIALIVPGIALGAQQQNPRGSSNVRTARSADSVSNAAIRRSATSVIARSAGANSRQSRAVVTARPATVRSASVRSVRPVVNGGTTARTASKSSVVRSGMKQKVGGANLSRAGVARATAVFNDITKIGGGYSNCRDAYATCMDQLCANANDTYRRCFCSDRFNDFRETSDRLDSALKLLADFQDNNLNAVDKTAAEVNAMYTATAGEAAIKRDTSASQQLLDSIGDVLAGKKTAVQPKQSTTSLGVLDFSSFSTANDDIFGAGSSLFGDSKSSEPDVSTLEGKELYDNALKQCSEITRESCGSDAMFNLARSAYSIMITQDCNAYEKNINAKKASVEETVRTAEKYLREARLEEYRSHNSADVNECLTKVEEAIRQPTACGEKYEKCLDYTGKYINTTTGEPIYSQALFGLNNLIVLGDTADVLGANSGFDKWLEEKKMFATSALDSCRDNADIVWYEFKRSALIQIAQAQDEKIQSIKDSCVATVKQCYDTQTGAMKSLDTTETQGTDAIAAVAARGMCYDRVQACAALYGDPDGCAYDDASKKLSNNGNKKCGLQSLLAFVDTVDAVKVAEGCESVLTKYAHELCPDIPEEKDAETGEVITEAIPYGTCASRPKNEIRAAMNNRMEVFCAQDLVKEDASRTIGAKDASGKISSSFNTNIMNQVVKDIYDQLGIAFTAGCEDLGGSWVGANEVSTPAVNMLVQEFYTKYYGTKITSLAQYKSLNIEDKGFCISADRQNQCSALGEDYSEGLDSKGQCSLTSAWYYDMCVDVLQGKWDGTSCVLDNVTQDSIK